MAAAERRTGTMRKKAKKEKGEQHEQQEQSYSESKTNQQEVQQTHQGASYCGLSDRGLLYVHLAASHAQDCASRLAQRKGTPSKTRKRSRIRAPFLLTQPLAR